RPRAAQPVRWGDRPRPPTGCLGHQAAGHAGEPPGDHRRPVRAADHVRGRRHGQRHDHRATVGGERVDITGQLALITGGASGLGRATAQALLAAGAEVVIFDLPSSAGERTAAELGERATFAAGDVTDPDSVAAALDLAATKGALRVVVNCAGIVNGFRTVSKRGPFPLADFRRVIDVNLVGTFNVIRLAAERIAATEPLGEERGVIISTASVAAFDGQIGQAAYSASKAGVAGMTL